MAAARAAADAAASAPVRLSNGTLRSATHTFFGRTFTVAVNDSTSDHATVVWDASVAFLRWLEHNPRELARFQNARVLELGAGTGLLGIALAHAAGARVVLTDLPHVCAALEAAVAAEPLPRGAPGTLSVVPYDWSGAADARVLAAGGGGPFDIIVGTDVAYSEALNARLVASAAAFARAAAPRVASVIFANELRCEVAQAVFDAAARGAFLAKRVPAKAMHPAWRAANMLIFKMRVKAGALKAAARAAGAGAGASAGAAAAAGDDGSGSGSDEEDADDDE